MFLDEYLDTYSITENSGIKKENVGQPVRPHCHNEHGEVVACVGDVSDATTTPNTVDWSTSKRNILTVVHCRKIIIKTNQSS